MVYQAWLEPHRNFVLSLFEEHSDPELKDQLRFTGKKVKITDYSCVYHLLHSLVIGASLEVYPKKIEVLS